MGTRGFVQPSHDTDSPLSISCTIRSFDAKRRENAKAGRRRRRDAYRLSQVGLLEAEEPKPRRRKA